MSRIAMAIALMLGQTAATTQTANSMYGGTWTAELAGTTYVRLELAATGGTLRGAMSLGNIQVDKTGVVTKAEAMPPDLTPLVDVVIRESHVSFGRKDVTEIDRFELRLVGADAADLTFIPTDADRKEFEAAGLTVPKPIRLKKLAAARLQAP